MFKKKKINRNNHPICLASSCFALHYLKGKFLPEEIFASFAPLS